MIKTLFVIFFLTFYFNTIAQKKVNEFVIYGEIKNQNTGYIKLDYINSKGDYTRDSALIINGFFKFKGNIPHPVYADIYGNIVFTNTGDINFQSIFIEPKKMNIVVEKDKFKSLKLTGSKTQNLIDSLWNLYPDKETVERLENLLFYTNLAYKLNPDNSLFKDSSKKIRTQLVPFYKEINSKREKFILNNLNSYYSVMMFENYLHRLSLDSLKLIFNRYPSKLKNSYYGRKIDSEIRGIEGGGPGSKAKEFEVTDINGDRISLAQFKERNFILLDFWASWCKPCREETPFLSDLYSKFKSKGLEIISIADDDNRTEIWRKAIIEDRIGDWKHVLQGKGTLNDLAKLYAVQPIPTKILIGKDGAILMRYEGTSGNKGLLDMLTYFLLK